MAAQAFLLIASFLVVLFVLARPLGSGLARLINNVPLPGTGSVEKGIWRVLGIDDREMNWRDYLIAILLLNIVGLIALFAMLMLQGILPLNPQQLPACPGISRLTRQSVLSLTPTGSPMLVKPRSATSARWSG